MCQILHELNYDLHSTRQLKRDPLNYFHSEISCRSVVEHCFLVENHRSIVPMIDIVMVVDIGMGTNMSKVDTMTHNSPRYLSLKFRL